MATQTLLAKKAKNMLVRSTARSPGITAKDIVLAIIGKIGTAGGTGYTIEFAGSAIRDLSMEGRMTVCNMAIEGGARAGLVAVDDKTIDYVKGRPWRPPAWNGTGRRLLEDAALRRRREVRRVVELDAAEIVPQVTWGTSPEMVLGIDARVPDPDKEKDANKRGAIERADLHGPGARQADQRHLCRQGVHRLLHQQPHRRHARSRRRGQEAGPKVAKNIKLAMVVPARAWSRNRPSAKAWTRSSRPPASSGASPAAPCAWP
jgi:3-isopropylmalate/(R)-2-methylmalate dehydratase large subunit